MVTKVMSPAVALGLGLKEEGICAHQHKQSDS
jgi:hypothetical protein